jgi:hypothetical protein
MTEERGQNLIFLVSQPRAGSTMLQRVLGGHPDVHTVGEPWLMLPPAHALRGEDADAPYDATHAARAVRAFLAALPEGEEAYFEGVRRMFGHLYARAREAGGKRLFLDKTPRYYSILPELQRVFPEARFLLLYRNPLAVLHSLYRQTWMRRSRTFRPHHRADLLEAPRLLPEGAERLGQTALVVRYEDLVARPEAEVKRICKWLGVSFSPDLLAYGGDAPWPWKFGDQGTVRAHERPVQDRLNAWRDGLADPQFARLAREYLSRLEPDTVARLGYSAEELERDVRERGRGRGRFLLSFDRMVPARPAPNRGRKLPWRRSLQTRGLVKTAAARLRELARRAVRSVFGGETRTSAPQESAGDDPKDPAR